jgi:hypothetical protein
MFENNATIVYLHRRIGEASVVIQFLKMFRKKRPLTRRIFRGTAHIPYAKVPEISEKYRNMHSWASLTRFLTAINVNRNQIRKR